MTKVAYVVDYPANINSTNDFSGAEISTELHANLLKKNGVEIIFLSYTKLFYQKKNKFLSDSFWLNPIIILYGAIYLLFQFWKYRPFVIHIHGKNSLISAFLANLIYRHRMMITVRDYKLFCNLGMCFLSSDRGCNFREYILNDIPFFAENYSLNIKLTTIKLMLLSPMEFVRRSLVRLILLSLDKVICISRAQQEILATSGIKNTIVIYNPVDLGFFPRAKVEKNKIIAFVGRYSLGKGKLHINNILSNLSKKYPDWKLMTIGTVLPARPNLIRLAHQSYNNVLKKLSTCAFAIVPSVWPEPFGRAALDPIGVGTPVVVTNKGGLPEIVEANVTGLVSSINIDDFWENVEKMISSYESFSKNIRTRKKFLQYKFNTKTIISLLKLYRETSIKSI